MKRTLICLSILLTGFYTFTITNSNTPSTIIRKIVGHGQTPQQHKNHSRPTVLFDGSVNPASIPDHVAYDILFRIFSAPELTELDKEKKNIYARTAGFTETEDSLIRDIAAEYEGRIQPINARINDIKDLNWPHPGVVAIGKLQQLKEEKQNLISSVVTDLQTRAGANNADAEKVQRFITEYIKPRIKGFGTDPSQPKRKVSSLLDKLTNYFTAYAQASYCGGFVYAYSNTTYSMSLCYLWGDGSYYAEPDSCGHTFNTMVTTTGPGGIYQSSSSGTSIYLIDANGFPISGSFYTEVDIEGFCSIVNQAFAAAFAYSQDGPPYSIAFTTISPAIYNPNQMSIVSGQTNLYVQIAPSSNLPNTTVEIQISQDSNPGGVVIEAPSGNQLTQTQTMSGFSNPPTKVFSFEFKTGSQNTTKGPVHYKATISSAATQSTPPTPVSIMGGNMRVSNELCVGTREGAPPNQFCPWP
ncbi:MAG: hypothetical protein KF868_13315 [Acidobacteria bacterium]|nr:hypothetical protein [Acidobacteriota bacterium]